MNPCNEIDCDNLAGLLDSITPIQCESIANGDGIDPLDATDSCQDTQTVIDRLQEMEDAISEGSIVIAANQESACYKPGLPTHASILNTTKQALQMVKCIICAPNKDAKAYHYNYNYDSAVTTQPDTVPANLVTGDTVIENFNDVIKYWTWNGSSWVLDFQIDKSDTVEITDADLAVPGTPTITDVQNYATANGLNNTAIYYIGNGTADNPDYVWIVDEQGNIVNVENAVEPVGGLDCTEVYANTPGDCGSNNLSPTIEDKAGDLTVLNGSGNIPVDYYLDVIGGELSANVTAEIYSGTNSYVSAVLAAPGQTWPNIAPVSVSVPSAPNRASLLIVTLECDWNFQTGSASSVRAQMITSGSATINEDDLAGIGGQINQDNRKRTLTYFFKQPAGAPTYSLTLSQTISHLAGANVVGSTDGYNYIRILAIRGVK